MNCPGWIAGKLRSKEMEMTPFSEWFDVRNSDHLFAFQKFLKDNCWPKHFLPADVEFNNDWNRIVTNKIMEAHIQSINPQTKEEYIGRLNRR